MSNLGSYVQEIFGTWRIVDKGFEGIGVLRIDNVDPLLELKLIRDETLDMDLIHSCQNKALIITGKTMEEEELTLIDCYLISARQKSESHAEYLFRARCAFRDTEVDKESEPLLAGAQINYGDIVEWANLSHFEPFFDGDVSGIAWVAKEPVNAVVGDTRYSIFPVERTPPYSYSEYAQLEQAVAVLLDYELPVPWQTILADAKCLAQLMSFAKREHVGIQGLSCKLATKQEQNEMGNEAVRGVTDYKETILPIRDKETQSTVYSFRYLFTLDELQEVGGLGTWLKHYPKLKPIMDLYLLHHSGKASTAEGYFLNLVQALESFHRRFVANSVQEYRKSIEDLLANIVPQSDRDYYYNLFLGNLSEKANDVPLRKRLIDLLYAEGQRPFILNMGQCEAFVDKVKDTRHYYTHYNPKKEQKRFRDEYYPGINTMLMIILEYHIMLLLGFDTEIAAERTVGELNPNWHEYYLSEQCLSQSNE